MKTTIDLSSFEALNERLLGLYSARETKASAIIAIENDAVEALLRSGDEDTAATLGAASAEIANIDRAIARGESLREKAILEDWRCESQALRADADSKQKDELDPLEEAIRRHLFALGELQGMQYGPAILAGEAWIGSPRPRSAMLREIISRLRADADKLAGKKVPDSGNFFAEGVTAPAEVISRILAVRAILPPLADIGRWLAGCQEAAAVRHCDLGMHPWNVSLVWKDRIIDQNVSHIYVPGFARKLPPFMNSAGSRQQGGFDIASATFRPRLLPSERTLVA